MQFSPTFEAGKPKVFRYLAADSQPSRPNRAPKPAKRPVVKAPRSKYAAHALDVVQRFGGVPELVHALSKVGLPKHKACIYRWLFPYPRGTAGRIPNKAWAEILVAAKWAKVDLNGIRVLPLRVNKNKPGVWQKAGGHQ